MNVQPLLVIVFLLFFQVNSRMRSTSHHICWQIFMSNKKGKRLNKITTFFQKMKFYRLVKLRIFGVSSHVNTPESRSLSMNSLIRGGG